MLAIGTVAGVDIREGIGKASGTAYRMVEVRLVDRENGARDTVTLPDGFRQPSPGDLACYVVEATSGNGTTRVNVRALEDISGTEVGRTILQAV